MSRTIPSLLLFLVATTAAAQNVDEWVSRGDSSAGRENHADAVAAYERALELDQSLRPVLLTKLARQLLWSGRAAEAAALFAERLDSKPDDCGARNDYGLALAWSNDLSKALAHYDLVIEQCPGIRNTARLRAAMVARWQDRPSLAARYYAAVEAEGTPAEQEEARTGAAHVMLMRGFERAALIQFDRLTAGTQNPAAAEGAAIAAARLGANDDLGNRIAAAEERGPLSPAVQELRERLDATDRYEVRPRTMIFRDADGTSFTGTEVGISRGWRRRWRGGLTLGRSELSLDDRPHGATWLELHAEERSSPKFGARVTLRRSSYEEAAWNPLSGQIHAVWTPGDELRVDGSIARLIVTDSVAAITHRLHGDLVSIGSDYRVTSADTIVAAVDRTSWSEGNSRTRFMANWRHQFEGVPRVTLEWPALFQRYDRPFSFGLFSPRRYVETGPALNAYRRFARVWSASAYMRGGAQREDGAAWRALGIVRVQLERDLRDDWALRVVAGWSNSNVTGAGGFRRTSFSIEAARRF